MNEQVKLSVYRRLDNRSLGLSDDSPFALELHNRRKRALHEAMDESPVWNVDDWQYTDDTQPKELVELLLSVYQDPTFQAIVVPAVTFVGGILVETGIKTATAEAVKELMKRLRGKQEEEGIQDYQIRLPDGTSIHVDPKDEDAMITIVLNKGKTVSFRYNSSQQDLDSQVVSPTSN